MRYTAKRFAKKRFPEAETSVAPYIEAGKFRLGIVARLQ